MMSEPDEIYKKCEVCEHLTPDYQSCENCGTTFCGSCARAELTGITDSGKICGECSADYQMEADCKNGY